MVLGDKPHKPLPLDQRKIYDLQGIFGPQLDREKRQLGPPPIHMGKNPEYASVPTFLNSTPIPLNQSDIFTLLSSFLTFSLFPSSDRFKCPLKIFHGFFRTRPYLLTLISNYQPMIGEIG